MNAIFNLRLYLKKKNSFNYNFNKKMSIVKFLLNSIKQI